MPSQEERNHCTAAKALSDVAAATSHQVISKVPTPRPRPVIRCVPDNSPDSGQR